MSSNKVKPNELRKSRKFYVGSVHEIASGKFEIIDRYLGEDDYVWLKYKMLDSGEVIENREVNVNSNLYKFRQKKKVEAFDEEFPELADSQNFGNIEFNKKVMESVDSITKQLTTLMLQQTLMMEEIRELKKKIK
ncbi:hypothetical protein CON64_18445 [Bacillus pseudomycoides]|nr:hypothetical protein CON64_18445 [Bacillus pseudomycoides]